MNDGSSGPLLLQMQTGSQVCRKESKPCIRLKIYENGYTLLYRLEDISDSVIRDIQYGEPNFRATSVNGIVAFLSRFGGMYWTSCFFHIGFYPDKEIPRQVGREAVPIHVLLVDAKTGILRAQRGAFLNKHLSDALADMISRQERKEPLSWGVLTARVQNLYSTAQLVAKAGMENNM